MGALSSVDLGTNSMAVAVIAGRMLTCVVLVRLHFGRSGVRGHHNRAIIIGQSDPTPKANHSMPNLNRLDTTDRIKVGDQ